MKTNAIVRIIIFSLAILILSGILLAFLFLDMYIADGRIHFDSTTYIEEPVAAVGQGIVTQNVQNIEIEWVAGSITIQPDESVTDIHITEYCSGDAEHRMVYRQSGQTLKIQYCEDSVKFPSFGINVDVSKDLLITVPTGWNCNKLEIDAAATEVDINDLNINEVDFDGASGQLNLNNCNIVSLDIDTASGDVEFNGILKELDFDAASAQFYGEFLQIPDHLNLDTMSGDLTLILPDYCGFSCRLDAMSGKFDSDFDTTHRDNTYIHGDGACRIDVSAMSGDVSILKGISSPAENCNH